MKVPARSHNVTQLRVPASGVAAPPPAYLAMAAAHMASIGKDPFQQPGQQLPTDPTQPGAAS